ncbi:MAG: serine hydrolase domain-containing protein [Pseudohongiellaceae bacterium]
MVKITRMPAFCRGAAVRLTQGILLALTVSSLSLHAQDQPGTLAVLDQPLSSPQPAPELGAYLNWLQLEFEQNTLPGAAVAIVSREGVLELRTWGVLSNDDPRPVDSSSLFRIASVSKTFAGTVATLLVDQGLQSWDTPLVEMFPQIQIGTGPSSNTITLRNIATHTTGLMPHAFSNMLDDGVMYEKIQEKFNEIPTVCAPGSCYGYQNVVFSLISDVVQLSTHKSYEEYLTEQLFIPLGMPTASTGLEAYEASANATDPHRLVRGNWLTTTTNPAYYTVGPASGINASVIDMSIWARANLGAFPEVLPETFLQQQQEPVVSTPRGNYFNRWQGLEQAWYATGWRVFNYRGARVVHHGGGVRGFRTEVALVPEKNLGLIVLFNAETRFANDVVPSFLDAIITGSL